MKKRKLLTLNLLALLLATSCNSNQISSESESNSPTPSESNSSISEGLPHRPEGQKIVIYAGGSSEFSWIAGSKEKEVIEYICDLYYSETGNSLDFEISYLGEDMHTKLSSELAAGSQVDIVISHTRGGNGIDDKLKGSDNHYNLYDALYDFAPNLYDAVKGDPLDSLTTFTNDVIAIPSVISPYKFGVLVRKDLMEACGYTDDEAKAKTEYKDGKNYELVDNLDTFTDMCLAMNKLTNNSYAITGAAWDIEKAFIGAYCDAGYFSSSLVVENNQELIMSGASTSAYMQMLKREYDWATSGVISRDANSILLEEGESNFIAGKTGVFLQDPTIQHLIKVARMTKNQNPEATFTVLGALKATKDSTRKGSMRNPEATFAAAITKNTKYINQIMSFLNWVYESEEHYNLCRYGIEGEHWVNNHDGTYSYPKGKEIYATQPAYSGILTLVENQRMSNLIYDGYTSEELHWIKDIAGNKDNYIDNDVMNYMFESTDEFNVKLAAAGDKLYTMAVEAWTGKVDPTSESLTKGKTVYEYVVEQYNKQVNEIQKYNVSQYKTMKAERS